MALRAVPDHPKFAQLKSILRQPKGATLGWLETIWHFASRFTPRGNLGKYSDDAIEAWVEWDGEPGLLVAALITCGWLDRDPDSRLIVHDWHEHADAMVHTTLARECQLFANGALPDSGRLNQRERDRFNAWIALEGLQKASQGRPKAAEKQTDSSLKAAMAAERIENPTPIAAKKPKPVPEPSLAGAGALPVPEPEAKEERARSAITPSSDAVTANGKAPPSPAAGFSDLKDEATMIARAVLDDTGLSGNDMHEGIRAQALVELKSGVTTDEIRDRMSWAWNERQNCLWAGKLKFDRGAKAFFVEGQWKSAKLWGLKKGEKANVYCSKRNGSGDQGDTEDSQPLS